MVAKVNEIIVSYLFIILYVYFSDIVFDYW